MSWSEQVFRYCERGADPALWAEPANALTNAAFLAAAAWAWSGARRQRGAMQPGVRSAADALTLIVAVIGIGSFLFHTTATRWGMVADVAPIGLFMLAYLAFALRVLLRCSGVATVLWLAAFVAALAAAGAPRCGGGPCLEGSPGYLPALAALIAIGAVLSARSHGAAPAVLGAGGLFAVSLTLRTLDRALCPWTALGGRALGTHFAWHLINAALLALLLRAAYAAAADARRA